MADDNLTFRDFAGAVMGGRLDEAARVLAVLLALDPEAALLAAAHFEREMKAGGAEFMTKAMGLRQAMTGGDEASMRGLLTACFAIDGAALDGAVAALHARYRS